MEKSNNYIGNMAIWKIMQKKGIDIEQLGHATGVPAKAIQKYIDDKGELTDAQFAKIRNFFGLRIKAANGKILPVISAEAELFCGYNLRKLLAKRKMSCEDLAAKINRTPETIGRWLDNKAAPGREVTKQLQSIFKVQENKASVIYRDLISRTLNGLKCRLNDGLPEKQQGKKCRLVISDISCADAKRIEKLVELLRQTENQFITEEET